MRRRCHKIASPDRTSHGTAELSRQFEQLTEIVGRGAPLDSMARARALGIVALFERALTHGAAIRTLERLRELVGGHESGRESTARADGDRGARLLAALDDVRGVIYDARDPALPREAPGGRH